jgi:hypothetical protein
LQGITFALVFTPEIKDQTSEEYPECVQNDLRDIHVTGEI